MTSGASDLSALPGLVADAAPPRGRGYLDGGSPPDLSRGVAERFADLGREHPDRPAISDEEGSSTFSEVLARARTLAESLAGHEGPVLLTGPRSRQLLCAVVAADAAGRPFVPFDSTWPTARLEAMLDRTHPTQAMVTSLQDLPSGLLDVLRRRGMQPIDLETVEPGAWEGFRPAAAHQESPAYVLFTSGSTGAPKGAVVARGGYLNHVLAKISVLRLDERDVVLQTAPLSFDIFVWQLVTGPLAGGRTVVVSAEVSRDPAALLDTVRAEDATVVELVPSVLALVIDAVRDGDPLPASLRWMISTGEQLPPALARAWLALAPGAPLLNAYGPTECSDDVTHFVVDAAPVDMVPVGVPIPGAEILVLRQVGGRWEPCDVGERGEVFVRGACVGLGYASDPEATRRAFYRPEGAAEGVRVYRTGDVGVVTEAGVLEYHGRVDRQVKLGGVRMELAEVEQVAAAHPAVRQCVAVVAARRHVQLVRRERATRDAGGLDLTLFYTANDSEHQSVHQRAATLRDHLRGHLPAAAVPVALREVEAMPLTPNGKIDSDALLAHLDSGPSVPGAAADPPADENERMVAEVVAGLLGMDVRMSNAFLTVGGTSLGAMQVTAELRRRSGRAVSLADVMESRSLRETAWRMAAAEELGSTPEVRAAPSVALSLTSAQRGVYYQWALEPESPYYTYQACLEAAGVQDFDRLRAAWEAAVSAHPQLLARFGQSAGEPVQYLGSWPSPELALSDWRDRDPEQARLQIRRLAHQEAQRPFDLHGEPPIRARIFRLGGDVALITMTMHEILLDGWGANALAREIVDRYDGVSSHVGGEAAFEAYVSWERGYLASEEAERARRSWADTLGRDLPRFRFPRDREPKGGLSYRGGIVEQALDPELCAELKALAADRQATIFSVLLTAYALALGYYQGTDEVVVGAPVANRDLPETDRLVAFVLNMVPIRIRMDLRRSRLSLVEDVHDAVQNALRDARLPLAEINRLVPRVDRSDSAQPMFRTMFNFLTYPFRPERRKGAEFHFSEWDTGYTKYDFSLYGQWESHEQMLLQLAYQRDLYEESTARRLLESTVRAATQIAREPEKDAASLGLLSDSDLLVITATASEGRQ